MKNILVTGACGFIGFHLSAYLCKNGFRVFGIDNFSCNDKKLLKSRLQILKRYKSFKFQKIDLSKNFEKKIKGQFYAIIHLAAKPGVRESEKKSQIYFKNNITAFYNIIEFAKKRTSTFIYASSSSVYGNNQIKKIGSRENHTQIKPLSFYALTKEINERFANLYSDKKLKCFGLRFFSVYGEYGRSDMAYYKFPLNALYEKKIILNNFGNDFRDFTHISDIVNGIQKLIKSANNIKKSENFNFGSNNPIKVKKIITMLKGRTKFKLRIINKGKNNLDPLVTNANIQRAKKVFGYNPVIKFEKGYSNFIDWFLKYHKVI